MGHLSRLGIAAVAIAVIFTSVGHAGPSPAAKCESSKLKAAGKACLCRHKVLVTAVTKGEPADFSTCATKLEDAFVKAEDKAAGSCPNNAEEPTVDGRLAAVLAEVSTALQAETATDPLAVKCAAAKLKAAGKKCACLHKTQAVASLKRLVPDFSKCEQKIEDAFTKAEDKAAGACPTTADVESICGLLEATFAEVEADVANLGTADYAAPGRYGVGLRTLTLVDTSRPTAPNGSYPGAPDRTLVTDVWYPTDPTDGTPQVIDAPFVEGAGPFPLIVRAHGFSGFRDDSKYILRHLASHGYVVVAPDFPLSHLLGPGGPTLSDVGEQARDLGFLIDYFTAENGNPASVFFGHIDTETIGAIGHSLGGATVLLATYHATLRDPRIDATVALSPLGCFLLDGFFDTAPVPLMIEGGTVDMITPYTSNHLVPYGYVNAPKYLVTLDGGTHLGFADRLMFGRLENGDAAIGCSIFVGPGDPRPITIDLMLPPDFLGGAANGIDPSGSMCEPICPLPPPAFMLHQRQNQLANAASLAFFEAKLRGAVGGGRFITGKIDAENDDVSLLFSE